MVAGHLPGDPEDAEAIPSVGSDVEVENDAVRGWGARRVRVGEPHGFDFQPTEGQLLGKLLRVQVPLKHFAEPFDVDTHGANLSGTAR